MWGRDRKLGMGGGTNSWNTKGVKRLIIELTQLTQFNSLYEEEHGCFSRRAKILGELFSTNDDGKGTKNLKVR